MLAEPNVKRIGKLGEGSFADVFLVILPPDRNLYAMKHLRRRVVSEEAAFDLPEVRVLQTLQGHPNVIKLHHVLYSAADASVSIICELMDCNLYTFLTRQSSPLPEPTSLLFLYQLLLAIETMHDRGMFHRDIKPENCMVNGRTLELKVIDFGSTCDEAESRVHTEYIATRWYRAPECILSSGLYGREVDLWAAGCILFECLAWRPLFPGSNEADQLTRINKILGNPSDELMHRFESNPNTHLPREFPAHEPQKLDTLLPKITPQTLDLLEKLLCYDPAARISATDALMHPAFDILRAYHRKWANAGSIGPFSQFVERYPIPVEARPPPRAPLADALLREEMEQEMAEEFGEEALEMLWAMGRDTEPKLKPNLWNSRLDAARRIKEYQNKVRRTLPAKRMSKGPAIRFSAPVIVKMGRK
jgi:renal tumor antigen